MLKRLWRSGRALLTLSFSLYSQRGLGNTSLLGFSEGAPFHFERSYYTKAKTTSLTDTLFCVIYGQSNLQWSSSSHDLHPYLRSSSEDIGSCRGCCHNTEVSCGFWLLGFGKPQLRKGAIQICLWNTTSPFHNDVPIFQSIPSWILFLQWPS